MNITPNRDVTSTKKHKQLHPTGLLIAFEGIDGSGKSTLASALFSLLKTRDLPVIMEVEPTYGKHGRRLRESFYGDRLPLYEETALFLADRREHVDNVILPAYEAGKIVLLDRYIGSTIAYQGARGALIKDILKDQGPIPQAHATFLLDIDPHVAQDRIKKRQGAPTSFEKINDQINVRDEFLKLPAKGIIGPIHCIDGAEKPDMILKKAMEILNAIEPWHGIMAKKNEWDSLRGDLIQRSHFLRMTKFSATSSHLEHHASQEIQGNYPRPNIQ